MSLTAVRITFTKPSGAYRANEVAWFSPAVAQALVDKGVGTALDAIPGGTAHAVAGSVRHAARVARESEAVTSEADRQLLLGEAAPVE